MGRKPNKERVPTAVASSQLLATLIIKYFVLFCTTEWNRREPQTDSSSPSSDEVQRMINVS